jgi:hypothetical protein
LRRKLVDIAAAVVDGDRLLPGPSSAPLTTRVEGYALIGDLQTAALVSR